MAFFVCACVQASVCVCASAHVYHVYASVHKGQENVASLGGGYEWSCPLKEQQVILIPVIFPDPLPLF